MGYRWRGLQFSIRCREHGQIFDSKCHKHITLICQRDKLPLVCNCILYVYEHWTLLKNSDAKMATALSEAIQPQALYILNILYFVACLIDGNK